MSKLTLDKIKNSLRLDYEYDDIYLQTLIDASDMFIVGATGLEEVPEDETRFETLQYMLVSLWYENRVPATSALQQQVPFTINAMIHQLRGAKLNASNPDPTS